MLLLSFLYDLSFIFGNQSYHVILPFVYYNFGSHFVKVGEEFRKLFEVEGILLESWLGFMFA